MALRHPIFSFFHFLDGLRRAVKASSTVSHRRAS
jgi:hypothetical protein